MIDIRHALMAAQLALWGLLAFCLVRALIVFITPEAAWQSDYTQNTTQQSLTSSRLSSDMQMRQSLNVPFQFTIDPFHRQVVTQPLTLGDKAPETTLNLKLYGRRAGTDGSAILETPDRQQAVYNIGDEIIQGVVLKAVTPDYIVLSQEGRLERLSFERSDTQGSGLLSRRDPAEVTAPQPDLPRMSAADFMSTVTLSRVVDGGSMQGYKITPKQSGVDLAALGFKDGDIITHIGDEDLRQGRPEFGPLIQSLSRSPSTNIQLIRDGQPLTLRMRTQ